MANVLVLQNNESSNHSDKESVQYTIAHLRNMGYTVDFTIVSERADNIADLLAKKSYDFVVACHPWSWGAASGDIVDLIQGNLAPVIFTNFSQSGAWTTVYWGVTRSNTNAYRMVTIDGIGEIPAYVTTYNDADTSGYPISPIGYSSANSDDLVMWEITGGTYPVVFDAAGGEGSFSMSLFPISLQHLLNRDSSIPKPPHRLMAAMDLDDFPSDQSGTLGELYKTTPAEVRAINRDLQDAGMVVTIGVHASKTQNGYNELADIWEPVGVVEAIAECQVRAGGTMYPIEHQGGTWWSVREINSNPSGGQTKADIDTWYKDHIDNLLNHGIFPGWEADGLDSYGYHYFNVNQLDDLAMQLATPWTTKLADPADTTAQQGYNWKIIRLDSNTSTRAIGLRDFADRGQAHGYMQSFMGMMLVGSSSPISVTDYEMDPASNVSDYAQILLQAYLTRSAADHEVLYLHGSNAYRYEDDSYDTPLKWAITFIGRVNNFCTDVLECVHPSKFANLYSPGRT